MSDSNPWERRQWAIDQDDVTEVGHAEPTIAVPPPGSVTGGLFARTLDQLQVCHICKIRRVPFMPSYYCDICRILWFEYGDECIAHCERLWHSDAGMKLSPLEFERLHWCIDNPFQHTNWEPFCNHILAVKPDLVEEIPMAVRKGKVGVKR